MHIWEEHRVDLKIPMKSAHQNTRQLARAHQVSISFHWLSPSQLLQTLQTQGSFCPVLSLTLKQAFTTTPSASWAALWTSFSTPSCSLSCSAFFSAFIFFFPGQIIVRTEAVMENGRIRRSAWGVGRGFKNCTSVGWGTEVGIRSRNRSQVLRGILSRGSWSVSAPVTSQAPENWGPNKESSYWKAATRNLTQEQGMEADLGSACFSNQEHRTVCYSNHGSGRAIIILAPIKEC